MGPFDPNALTPEMKIFVTLGEFHRTHNTAYVILGKMYGNDLSTWTPWELAEDLAKLRAAQRLTDAETGDDDGGTDYRREIQLLQKEIERRKK
ncbi:MAG: hypothetical protein A3A96_03505 [Candidatus Zambryskibacteria bacterium RIFCSPLOWO2_01_FULL_39_39]|uniref:Uncharacterized protein n=1 Tax=Candidatus Zambryskibacteria bacterium RIFCSPLOWO2_01_FULL_39_39 TaxID=1802758 RepID=A0A1G2TXP5_9BACT|nr:MAG: hypothetical protein A3A96_03505 [Candidatus Zambryskibacteria bacterium RIFCSPLOWO2_01_FULL_39_39]